MPATEPFNLFVYGTLKNPSVFRAVLGKQVVRRSADADDVEKFFPRRAILNGYKMVSPDNTYLYAVPAQQGRIAGYVIGPLPHECMAALRKYEGRNYSRRTLTIQTSRGPERAVAFLGHLERMEHSFGYEFRDPFKQEVLLNRKIEAAIAETGEVQLHSTAAADRRVVAELHGQTIRDLMRRHFEAGGISDYAIRRSLLDRPLPDFSRIRQDPEAQALAPNYLELVVRQVIFNEFESKIRADFRYELDHMRTRSIYYERTLSSLCALRMINRSGELLDQLVPNGLAQLHFGRDHLVDYVRWAIMAADSIFDPQLARHQLDFIRNHVAPGYIPLGAELEFSNIGHRVIHDPGAKDVCDPTYDGFIYFNDFGLDALTWKLGGHLDDHHEKAASRPRRGFFEVALGNVSVQANLSKPLTDDPWLLNQLIHETRRFYPIRPHSMHLSLQLRSQQHKPVQDRRLPLSALKCLFLIAGDPVRTEDGRCRIMRLANDEILGPDMPAQGSKKPRMHLLFSEISRRRSANVDDSHPLVRTGHLAGRYVQQFKFLRLSPDVNYEPVAMALKGLQIRLRPGSFLTAKQFESSAKHRRLVGDLLEWGRNPEPITREEREEFRSYVNDGLLTERRGKPAHSRAYIAWSLDQLREMIARANDLLTPAPPTNPARGGPDR